MSESLPKRAFVTLSEAASWIAFGRVLDKGALRTFLMSSFRHQTYLQNKDTMLRAVESLTTAAHANKLRLQGVISNDDQRGHTPDRNTDIDPARMVDYRMFDVIEDGLRFGTGLAWLPDEKGYWVYIRPIRRDYFRNILVDRLGLMRVFSNVAGREIPNQSGTFPPLSEAAYRQWYTGLTDGEKLLPQMALEDMCRKAHPKHTVIRAKIRALAPNRKRGRRPNRPESAA